MVRGLTTVRGLGPRTSLKEAGGACRRLKNGNEPSVGGPARAALYRLCVCVCVCVCECVSTEILLQEVIS